MSLAVVTLAAAVAVEEVVFKSPLLTGGFEGALVPGWPPPAGPGAAGSASSCSACWRRSRSAWPRCVGAAGRRLLAVRANERAAAACGIDVAGTKLAAFALSAFIAGVGGALLGYRQGRCRSPRSACSCRSPTWRWPTWAASPASPAPWSAGCWCPAVGFSLAGGRLQLLVGGLGLIVIAVLRPQGVVGRRRR